MNIKKPTISYNFVIVPARALTLSACSIHGSELKRGNDAYYEWLNVIAAALQMYICICVCDVFPYWTLIRFVHAHCVPYRYFSFHSRSRCLSLRILSVFVLNDFCLYFLSPLIIALFCFI